MPIQDKLLGRYKYPNYDITYEDFLREQERKNKLYGRLVELIYNKSK